MNNWKNKTAIITGAAGGIGSALCKKLAGYGMNLVIVGRNADTLKKTEEMIQKNGGHASICLGDLEENDFSEKIVKHALDTFGGIDVLINNAGLSHRCTVDEMTEDLFDQIMKVNVRAPYFLTQKALPELRKSDMATIINICSVVAHKGYPMQSVYAASKHALLGWSKLCRESKSLLAIRITTLWRGLVSSRGTSRYSW